MFVSAHTAQGPSADICCNHLKFFTDRPTAQTWADTHPQISGTIVDLADAQQLGNHVFADQLRD